jgi:hypothetical protein
MLMHNVSAWNATNRWFMWHEYAWQGKDVTLNVFAVTSAKTAPCPSMPRAKLGIRPFFTRVKDIKFWHGTGSFFEFQPKLEALRRSLPDELYFHPVGNLPIMCFATKETQSRFYG